VLSLLLLIVWFQWQGQYVSLYSCLHLSPLLLCLFHRPHLSVYTFKVLSLVHLRLSHSSDLLLSGDVMQLDVASSQLLVTDNDFKDPEFRLQLSETVNSLLDHRVVPVFNENDAISTRKAPYKVKYFHNCSITLHSVFYSVSWSVFPHVSRGEVFGICL